MILCEQNLSDFGFEFDLNLAQKIADELTNKDIELVLLDESAMRALNFEQRGVNKATDVLSFPLVDICENLPQGVNFGDENLENGLCGVNFSSKNAQNLPLGSIVINANAVFNESQRLKHSAEAEFTLLFLHALLHLLGYDHERDSGQMRTMEKRLIERFKLPQSLIIRNE